MAAGLTLLICGGGNGTHVLAGLAPTVEEFSEVYVLSTFADEAERIARAAATQNGEIHVRKHKEGPNGEDVIVRGKPTKITNDPSIAAKADVIVFIMPAFAHGGYLKAIQPFIRKAGGKASGGRVILGAMPGQSGFEIQAQHILGEDVFNNIAIFATQSLPWVARISEFGKLVDVPGTKLTLEAAVTPAHMGEVVMKTVEKLMAGPLPKLPLIPSMLAITLMNPNQTTHPTVTWGQYRNWDGKTPFDKPPLFYEGVTEEMGDMMSSISDEVLEVKKYLESRFKVDLTGVIHDRDWMIMTYGDDIKDKSTLASIYRTNKPYEGITHPMVRTDDGKYMPDLKQRYLSEDVPYGLIVTRGIAELCGIKTPSIDTVVEFASKWLGKSFIVDGKVAGPDINITRSPQAFGINSIEEFIHKLNY